MNPFQMRDEISRLKDENQRLTQERNYALHLLGKERCIRFRPKDLYNEDYYRIGLQIIGERE